MSYQNITCRRTKLFFIWSWKKSYVVKGKCRLSFLDIIICRFILRVDLNPRISKICASWMWMWNISANYVLVPVKFNLNWIFWKPFLNSSPFDFSGQRLGNTSLVVFLRFYSCLLPRVLALYRFPAQQRNNSSAGADDQAQNRRIQNR